MDLLQEHTRKVYGVDFALSWPYFLAEEVAAGDEEKSVRLLFSLLDSFLVEQGAPSKLLSIESS